MTKKSDRAGGGAYRLYVLAVLILIYTSNFIDRMILAVLGQPMKQDLGLSDLQLGVLGGFAFAILYSTLGLPIAAAAERTKRVNVITAGLTVWSLMTAVCGLAANYGQLLAARIGVGVGEAAFAPPSASLLSDYYPPERRATALGLLSLGIPLGTIIGVLIGGYVSQHYGWRTAFFVVGVPGLLLAVLLRTTVREPLRGRFDQSAVEPAPSMAAAARRLFGKPAYLHVCLGAALTSFAAYGVTTFAIPYLMRGFGLSVAAASVAFAVFGGLAAAVGVAAGGPLSDWLGRKDRRLYVLVPAAGLALAGPLFALAFLQPTLKGLATFIVAPLVVQYLYLGPAAALCQNMARPRERALASAYLTLVINLIGLGLGPPLLGLASDLFASAAFSGGGDFQNACPGGQAPAGSAEVVGAACRAAAATGLQRALVFASAIYLWAALHFLLAARTLRRDLEV